MNLKQLNDKEYLLGISKDVKKLKEACDKDIGILFAKFKHFSIYPDFDILKEIKTVPARLFLLNNYDLDDNQIKEFIKDPYSGFVFLKDNSQFLKNMPAPVVKNPVQYAQSVDIGSFNGEFELGKNFKELSTWLKVFKYNMSKVLDLNSHTKKMIKACFNKLVNETTHIELNQILKLKEVINAENKLLVNVLKAKLKNKKELTPDEHKYVEVFQAFSREKNILEGKDCDLDVAFKKLQKLRELNVDASDPEMLYQEKLIMYMVAGHSKLKEPGKLNELLTKWVTCRS